MIRNIKLSQLWCDLPRWFRAVAVLPAPIALRLEHSASLMVAVMVLAASGQAMGQTSDGQRQEFVLSTATTGGAFHQGGVSLSALVKIQLLPNRKIDLTTRNSSGSMENIARLSEGSSDFAIVQGLLGHHARKGTGPANRLGPQRDLRAVTMLWPNVEHFIVRKDTTLSGSIEDLTKLKGKRFSFGREGSAIESNRFLLQNLGLNIDQDFERAFLAFRASASAFRGGEIDGLSLPASTPVPAFVELIEQLGPDATILDWTEDALRIADAGLGLWSPVTIPAGTYAGQTRPINTVAQPNFLAVRADVDDEAVYAITKAIFENLPFLTRLHKPFQFLKPETAIDGLPVPLHPGALRYFQEIRMNTDRAIFAENDYDIFGNDGQSSEAIRADVRRGVVSLMMPEDGTSNHLVNELIDVLSEEEDLRILPLKGKGTAHNLADLLYLKGVDISVLQTDAMEFARKQEIFPGLTQDIRYITKWHDLEIHLLVRDDILKLNHLTGKPVNFGPHGSGSELTASSLFNKYRVLVQQTSFSHKTALEKLKAGDIAGMVYVAGKPVPLFEKIEVRDGLRLLSLPDVDEQGEARAATITEKDYPTLVFGDRTIKTLAIPSVLATYDWPTDNPRYEPIASFVNHLLAHLDDLQNDGYHSKWRDVDPSFSLDLWQRHQASEAFLRQSRSEDKAIGQGGPLETSIIPTNDITDTVRNPKGLKRPDNGWSARSKGIYRQPVF